MSKRSLLRLAASICFMLCVIVLGRITVFADEIDESIRPTHYYEFDYDGSQYVYDTIIGDDAINGTSAKKEYITGYDGKGKAKRFSTSLDSIGFHYLLSPGEKSIRFKFRKDASTLINGNTEPIISTLTRQDGNGFFMGIGNFENKDNNGNIYAFIKLSSNKIFELQSPISICDGQWHDILFTWDGTTNANSVKLYIDNMTTPVAQTTANSIEKNANDVQHIGFCSYEKNTKQYLIGDLDNIQIFNKVIISDPTDPGDPTNPGDPTSNKTLLVITMVTGERKEYEMTTDKINDFITWYNSKAASSPTYVIEKDYNKASFTARKDYITYEQISNFEVNEYNS